MKILKLAVALLVTTWVSSANATLIFDFTVTDGSGNTLVTGEILGLKDNATGAATSVKLSPLYAQTGVLDDFKLWNEQEWNSFTVENGILVAGDYKAYDDVFIAYADVRFTFQPSQKVFVFDWQFQGGAFNEMFGYLQINQRVVSAPPSNPQISVPEPSTVILMSLGIVGLSFSRYRKQS
jgi:hypothetical protein